MAIPSHRDLEQRLRSFNAAYNARRQRALGGKTPDQIAAERLAARPDLANARLHGRAGPGGAAKGRPTGEPSSGPSPPAAALGAAASWARELEEMAERIAPRFCRTEPRRRALAYLSALLAPVQRKNGWQLARAAGDATPDGMRRFLSRTRWDADAVRDDLRAYVVEHLGDADAVLVLGETAFAKTGDKSVGARRRRGSAAGPAANSQIGAFLAYASRHGQALMDRALHLPESWAENPARRMEAGIPEDVGFATGPQLGLTMLERALDAGVPCAWVAGGGLYGADRPLRRRLEARRRGYVLAAAPGQRVGFASVEMPAEDLARAVPAADWHDLGPDGDATGPQPHRWGYLPCRATAPGWRTGLLIRRSVAEPGASAYYLTHAPAGATLDDLARVAGAHRAIDSCLRSARAEAGLGGYEVRSWTGWHRHVTLAMLAHACLAVARRDADREALPRSRRCASSAGVRRRESTSAAQRGCPGGAQRSDG